MDSTTSEQRLKAFLRIQAEVLAADMSLDRLMTSVAEAGMAIFPQANGMIVEMLADDESVYGAGSGIATRLVGRRAPIAGSLFERCILASQAHICDDITTSDSANRDACIAAGIHSLALAPVHHDGAAWGVVKALAPRADVFDPSDLLALQILAGALSAGLVARSRDTAFHELEDASANFRATFDQAAVGIAHVAMDGAFLRVNDRFCTIAGHSRAALLEHGFSQITHPDDLGEDLVKLGHLIEGKIDHYTMEKRYVRANQSTVWVNLTVAMVKGSGERPPFFVSVIEDISARKAAEEHAFQDALTGLHNRRWLIEQYWPNLDRGGGRSTIFAYLDLDGFKGVNDRFGHAEGDRCLVDVSDRIRRLLRDGDCFCRIAGDEFVLVLPDIGRKGGASVLARLHEAVSGYCGSVPWDLGISIGAIEIEPQQPVDLVQLLNAADKLMYASKRSYDKSPVIHRLGELPSRETSGSAAARIH